jgi:hypothetical protein
MLLEGCSQPAPTTGGRLAVVHGDSFSLRITLHYSGDLRNAR